MVCDSVFNTGLRTGRQVYRRQESFYGGAGVWAYALDTVARIICKWDDGTIAGFTLGPDSLHPGRLLYLSIGPDANDQVTDCLHLFRAGVLWASGRLSKGT